MRADEARAISGSRSESIYRKVYEAIKDAAERGESRVVVHPCKEWYEFYEHFTTLGYDVSRFYYHWEEEMYAEIVW